MENFISYSKTKEVNFEVYRINLAQIDVIVEEKLSVLEKYILLLLEASIPANNKIELIEFVATILNVKTNIVESFIQQLTLLEYLDYKDGFFSLSPNFLYDKGHVPGKEFLAFISIKQINYDDLYYIPLIKKLVTSEYFVNCRLIKLETPKIKNSLVIEISDLLRSPTQTQDVKNVIQQKLKAKGIHLKPNFSFKLSDQFEYLQINFDLTVNYQFANNISKIENVRLEKNDFISIELLNQISKKFEYDNQIPRFIALQDNYYQQIDTNYLKFTSLKKLINNEKLTSNEKIAENDPNSKNEYLEKLNSELKYEDQQTSIITSENKRFTHPLISETIKKFDNSYYISKRIIKTLVKIDKIISISDSLANEQLIEEMESFKDFFKNTLKQIFDSFFEKPQKDLAKYFFDENFRVKTKEIIFNKQSIPYTIFLGIKELIAVLNAFGHKFDNNTDKIDPQETIKRFLNYSAGERLNKLLFPVQFFKALQLSPFQLEKLDTYLDTFQTIEL